MILSMFINKDQVKKGSSLIESTVLACMTVGVAMTFVNNYSHMLKNVLATKECLLTKENQCQTITETYKEINGRIISDKIIVTEITEGSGYGFENQ